MEVDVCRRRSSLEPMKDSSRSNEEPVQVSCVSGGSSGQRSDEGPRDVAAADGRVESIEGNSIVNCGLVDMVGGSDPSAADHSQLGQSYVARPSNTSSEPLSLVADAPSSDSMTASNNLQSSPVEPPLAALQQQRKGLRVSFPDGIDVVSGYMDPPTPWNDGRILLYCI